MNGHEHANPAWKTDDCELLRELYWSRRCEVAESLLKHVFTKKEIGRACHIYDLEEKVKKIQREITNQREAAEDRNHLLEAANLIVNCTGGCDNSFMGQENKINEKIVCEVEMIAKRLRSWWGNYRSRQDRKVYGENPDPPSRAPEPPPAPPNV